MNELTEKSLKLSCTEIWVIEIYRYENNHIDQSDCRCQNVNHKRDTRFYFNPFDIFCYMRGRKLQFITRHWHHLSYIIHVNFWLMLLLRNLDHISIFVFCLLDENISKYSIWLFRRNGKMKSTQVIHPFTSSIILLFWLFYFRSLRHARAKVTCTNIIKSTRLHELYLLDER